LSVLRNLFDVTLPIFQSYLDERMTVNKGTDSRSPYFIAVISLISKRI